MAWAATRARRWTCTTVPDAPARGLLAGLRAALEFVLHLLHPAREGDGRASGRLVVPGGVHVHGPRVIEVAQVDVGADGLALAGLLLPIEGGDEPQLLAGGGAQLDPLQPPLGVAPPPDLPARVDGGLRRWSAGSGGAH